MCVITAHARTYPDFAFADFVLDLAPNGDLKALVLDLGSLSLECARFYTAQMVDAILFMHEAGVTHRDIKPENCLLDESMRILVADFGSAHVSSDLSVYRTSTFVGTAMFISPEVLGRSKCDPRGFGTLLPQFTKH
jgi:3-phosphoinositide dependent protein kinase-1